MALTYSVCRDNSNRKAFSLCSPSSEITPNPAKEKHRPGHSDVLPGKTLPLVYKYKSPFFKFSSCPRQDFCPTSDAPRRRPNGCVSIFFLANWSPLRDTERGRKEKEVSCWPCTCGTFTSVVRVPRLFSKNTSWLWCLSVWVSVCVCLSRRPYHGSDAVLSNLVARRDAERGQQGRRTLASTMCVCHFFLLLATETPKGPGLVALSR